MIDLLHGDCLDLLKNIPDRSVDLVLTDPPYGTTPCDWDKVLNFSLLWPELERITKKPAAICIFGTEPFSSLLRSSNQTLYKYDWYWKKCKSLGANFCHAKNSPIRLIETISIFSSAKINHVGRTNCRMNYNPQGLQDCHMVENVKSSKINSFRKNIERKSDKKYVRLKTGYPSNVLDIGFLKGERKNRLHPTQKPVALLEYLIKTYTNEGDTVLDFTMGSGSTGVAAKNLNRNFIGIEKDDNYFEIAKKRINDKR